MKKLLLALALFFAPSLAAAQCTGLFPPNTVCGNFSGVAAPPSAVTASSGVFGPGSSTVGHFATWANTSGTLLADFNLFGTANTWTAGQIFSGINTFSNTNTFSAIVKLTGLSGGAQVSCLGLDSSNNVVSLSGACNAVTPILGTGTNSKAANYTVLDADIHKVIYLTGTTGNQTITVSALSSYASSAFSVGVCNKSTRRWTVSSVDAGNLSLWPGQCNTLQSDGSVLAYSSPPVRFLATTVKVGPGGSCNNANDGITADSTGQLCSFNSAILLIQSSLDTRGSIAEIDVAAGAYTENVFFAGLITGGGDQISIVAQGNISNTVASGAAFGVRDLAILTLAANGHTLSIGCVGGVGLEASQFGTLDGQSIQIASCTTPFSAADHGHINISGATNFVATTPNNMFTAANGGFITLAGSVTGTATTTNFTFVALATGIIAYEGGPVTWDVGITATTKWSATTAGGVHTSGDLAAIPGTGAGVTTSPGWSD